MTVTANKETRVIVSNTGFSNPIEIDQYVEQSSHLKVYADDVELALGVDYTIDTALPADGVEITITATGLLHAPDQWIVFHDPPMEQGADLSLGGRFGLAYEQALDALARRLQAMNDKVKRGLRLPINTDLDVEGGEFPVAVADNIIGWNAGGTRLENKGTVPQLATIAGIAADIPIVSDIAAEIATLSPISADITGVAAIANNVTTVAGIAGNVTTVVGIAGDVTTVAGISANVTTVAGVATAVATLAPISAAITTVAGRDAEVAALGVRATEIDALYAELPSIAAKLNIDGANVSDAVTFRDNVGAASLLDVRRNRIVNPCIQISQENGDNAGTTTGYYAADQWQVTFSTDGAISFQRVQSATPAGASDRLRVSVTSADATLSAGQFLLVSQKLEGLRMADAQFGTAGAVDLILRFGFKGPAGTYAILLQNAAQDRSYLAEFTVSSDEANSDTVQEISIPGDTTGAWPSDNSHAMTLFITLAAGTNYHGTNEAWNAGNYIGTASVSNGLASDTNVFEIFDVGLRLDPDRTGVYGQFEVPDPAEELLKCQRYWETGYFLAQLSVATGAPYGFTVYFKATKRATPSITYASAIGNNFTAGNINANDLKVGSFRAANTAIGNGNGYFGADWKASARL